MEKLVIKGGKPLHGKVSISGAKNSSLPVISATILADGRYVLKNVPDLMDTRTMLRLMDGLGVSSERIQSDVAILNTENFELYTADYELVRTMRASILVLGPLLSKRKRAKVSLPGGCAIGERPVDLHMKALSSMGADIKIEHGYIHASCERLKGSHIYFDTVTVTGTENVIMAATLAEGRTVIENAAQEPEVVDLVRFLRSMGADIEGEGSKKIVINGVKQLHPADFSVMSDRIEAGTFLGCVAATGGSVEIENAPIWAMTSVLEKYAESGLNIDVEQGIIKASMDKRPRSCDATTQPYPGFPTDMQAQFMSLMAISSGTSVITENIFENRFMHAAELKRMGADITIKDRVAIIKGVKNLSGAHVMASDLRASASLVIAALAARGESQIHRIYHLDRGYERFDKKLSELGAEILRVKDI